MPGRAEGGNPPATFNPIAYLGTVDFIKMHPGFFDAMDALEHHATAAIWGGYDVDGEVASRAHAMRHPERIRFMGQTSDPQSALSQSRIFFYPLQPDHYGTAENALIEAMSLGLVPVVLVNAAECAIVEHGVTGLIGNGIEECAELVDMLLSSPEKADAIGRNAAAKVAEAFTPDHSARAFATLWDGLIAEEKRLPDFAGIVGPTPLDWFLSTQYRPGEKRDPAADTGKLSKGTLSHFRSAFPDDPCWQRIAAT
jgi:glycosyltransferase involved in cell wall biosynthesis